MKGYLKYIGFLVVIALVVLWLAGVFRHKEKTEEIKTQAKVVEGIKVGRATLSDEVYNEYVGNVVAEDTAEISTRLAGMVKEVRVKEGDYVKRGQLLVVIDSSDISAQVGALEEQAQQAEEAYKSALAHYEAVRKTYERYEALLKENAITPQEFDQIKAQFESAKAQVEQAKAGIRAAQMQKQAVSSNLDYANLRAPFDGYVAQKRVDVGDLASPGMPLLVLEKPPYKLEVHLPERYINRIKKGERNPVMVGDRTIEGVVSEVAPSIDPITRTFRVKLELADKDIRSGMYAKLLLPEKSEVVLVPESAIFRRFDFTGVWVVKPDKTMELRLVKLGEKRGDMVEVLSGLKGDEEIVIEGIEKACDGCRVGG